MLTLTLMGQTVPAPLLAPPPAPVPVPPFDPVVARLDRMVALLEQLVVVDAPSIEEDGSETADGGPPLAAAAPPNVTVLVLQQLVVEVRKLQELTAAPRVRTVERDRTGEIVAVHEQVGA